MEEMRIELNLEAWKRALLVLAGATVTLLATAIADFPEDRHLIYPGWFAIWLIIQLAVTPPGIALSMSNKWRAIALRDRLDTEFGFLILAWAAALAFVIRTMGFATTEMLGFINCARFLLVVSGIALVTAYLLLKGRASAKLKDLFP
jgi:hypothetical protein